MNKAETTSSGFNPDEIGFEQFTEPDIPHEFSAEYQSRRQALIREAERNAKEGRSADGPRRVGRFTWRAIATIAAACIVVPTAAWAITSHLEFFDGAFGTGWRQSQNAEQSFQDYDDEKPPTPVVYPASEAVQIDAETAEALLGGAVCDEPVIVTAPDGHELTITSAVRSENALVYRFTLHRDGGVTCLYWDEHTNNVAAKGAYTSPDARFSWAAGGDQFIYIDPDASTADTLVGYAYCVYGEAVPDGRPAALIAYMCDAAFSEDFTEDQFHMQRYEIPCTTALASERFESAEGSTVDISPIGLVLDQRALFAEPANPGDYDMAHDPVWVQSITVKMADGETYAVFDGPSALDNTLAQCGFEAKLSMAFNRLVDPSRIASIEASITDVKSPDDLIDASGNTLPESEWPVRTVVYSRL